MIEPGKANESMISKVTSWGNYPKINASMAEINSEKDIKDYIGNLQSITPRGNGRSYGDSALGENIISLLRFNKFISFDEKNGILHCESGVLLSEIVEVFLSRGWFLSVTPGTKLITVGGAIASDVHGKNHHQAGCFSNCIVDFRLLLPDGSIITCSKDENVEIFKATCGGMGLTGIVLDVRLKLLRIESVNILQQTTKTKNLQSTFDAFERYKEQPYSVAWIDCLASKNQLGKCLLMTGDHAHDKQINYAPKKPLSVPFYFPSFSLNTLTVKMFNFLYYKKVRKDFSESLVSIDSFFYPLDAINNWNRIYGRPGFTQYQFVLPKSTSYDGLFEILTKIQKSGKGSFLAVLKLFGKGNNNYLSFPVEGYTLALDFKITQGIFKLLDDLDKIVIKYKGRIYLTKDTRVSEAVFKSGYEHIDKFIKIRKELGAEQKFSSLQSKRLNL